ncbi:MAG: anion permease, partial [Anaerolineales bacterium]|nr:anion permease [Anaerolineales bacterium]
MTLDNWIILVILGVSLLLFISEKIRVDLVALMVLVSLVLTGLISPEDAFSGFASPAVITVWAVFIISGGLTRSGVADVLARFILRLAGRSPVRLTVLIMLTVGVMSAFMNNIGAVAILLPAVISVARDLKI